MGFFNKPRNDFDTTPPQSFPLPPNHCTPYLSVSNPKSGPCAVFPLCYLLPLHPGQRCLLPLCITFVALKASSRCMSCGPSTFQPTVSYFISILFFIHFLLPCQPPFPADLSPPLPFFVTLFFVFSPLASLHSSEVLFFSILHVGSILSYITMVKAKNTRGIAPTPEHCAA